MTYDPILSSGFSHTLELRQTHGTSNSGSAMDACGHDRFTYFMESDGEQSGAGLLI